jgi:VanZ family protein
MFAPGAAAPIAFSLLIALLLGGRSWIPFGFPSCLGFGTLAVWFATQPRNRTTWMLAREVGPITRLLAGLAIFASVVTLARLFRATPVQRRALLPLLPLLAMTLLVAKFSGDAGGSDPMRQWFASQFHLTPGQAHVAVILVRKAIHFTFYGLIGFTATRAARYGEEPATARWTGLGYAFLLACFDEVRQSDFANRTGSAWDVGLDMLGALAGSAIALRIASRSAKRT